MTHKNFVLRILLIALIALIPISILFGVYSIQKFYSGIFRLSTNQVSSVLPHQSSLCKKLSECRLQSGDILIRRYITNKTQLMDKLINPYFTHTAFYLGSNKIVEAVGTERNPEDEIQIVTLSESDWFDTDIETLAIIRPIYYFGNLVTIKKNLENIAVDPNYRFGLPKNGQKRATCADLIFDQLSAEAMVDVSRKPKIITVDYIFWLMTSDSSNFKIVGFNFNTPELF